MSIDKILVPCQYIFNDHDRRRGLFHGVYQEGETPVAIVETLDGELISIDPSFVRLHRQDDQYQMYLKWLQERDS